MTTAINEKVALQVKKPVIWRIGGAKSFEGEDQQFLLFRFGRTTTATHNIFDEEIGDYAEEIISDANFTYVIFDFEKEVCAIAENNRLSYDLPRIVTHLTRLINTSLILSEQGCVLSLAPIPNSQNLFEKLDDAGALVKFRTTITRPNPIDVDPKLHDPMREAVEEMNGNTANLEFKGESLNKEVAKQILRSTLASGEVAKISVRGLDTGKIRSFGSDEDQATFDATSNGSSANWDSVVNLLRQLYASIRDK